MTDRRLPSALGLPISEAVVLNGSLAFISGQGPIQGGEIVGDDIEAQTRVALGNLGRLLEELGAEAAAVVKCTCYLRDLADFAGFNRAYSAYFASTLPARTTVGAQLVMGMLVEIDAIVALTPASDASSPGTKSEEDRV
jgi:2-iminobutanoate/2-iminopropanoate deaminase